MVTETLQVNILAKIRDFEKKMGIVDKKINAVDKGSKSASKTLDKMLSTKASGTHKAVDLVNKKLAQVNRSAAVTKKALSGKMMFSADSSGIDLQKVKIDQLRQKYADLTSGVRVPVALKTMDKEYSQLGTQIDAAKAKQAALNAEIEQFKWNEMASAGSGNIVGAEGYHAQILSAKAEMGTLVAATSELEARAGALSSKMQTIRMNPSASPEARLLAAQIQAADAKMEKLGTDTTTTTKKISGIRSGGGALDAINRKISNLERSSARTARSVTALGRRFLVLFTGKLISMAFNGLQDGLTGASTKSDQLKSSLDTLTSAGRTISNSVVTALTPLINVAAPMIDYISKKIMDFGNSVAMFFASISGQDAVLQATKAYEEYGAAASGAGDSAAAGAEKARNALAGFDQITKLDTSTSSSGSGSSGAADDGTTSYITVPVVQSELAKKFSDAIEKLKGPLSEFYENVLKPIGAWVMGPGVDFLAAALTSVADFVDEHPTLTGVLLTLVGALLALKAVGAIGLAVKATITGLSALTSLLGLGGTTAATGVITVSASAGFGASIAALTLAVAGIAVFGIGLATIITGLNNGYDMLTPEGRAQAFADVMGQNQNTHNFPNQTGGTTVSTKRDINGNIISTDSTPVFQNRKLLQDAKDAYNQALYDSGYLKDPESLFPIEAGGTWIDKMKEIDKQGKLAGDTNIALMGTFSSLGKSAKDSTTGFKFLQDGAVTSNKAIAASVQDAMNKSTNALKYGTRDQSRTYQDYLYGLTTQTGSSYGLLTSTVDLGTKDAARYMQTNIGAGVQGVNDSFGGMPSSVQALLAGLNNTVWGGMNTVSGTLAERTAGGVNTAIGSYSGMPSAVQEQMTYLNSAVWGGATTASSLLSSNVGEGVNTALGSYSGMPSAVEAQMQSLAEAVDRKSVLARDVLWTNTQEGVDNSKGQWSRFSNDGTTKITTFADNVRLAMEAVLRNMSKLPSTAAEARGFSGLTSGFLEGIHRLPMFATGGVVNSATAAIIGESGKEAVMPLERNTGWIDKLADKINSRGGGGGDIYLTVQTVLDGQVVAEKVTKIQKRDARRSNKPVWGNV